MSNAILLSDTLSHGEIGNSRYIGPYVIATHLEQAGFDTCVIDYFTRIPDFFSYLESFLSKNTLVVGISTTFLLPPPIEAHTGRGEMHSPFLWMNSSLDLNYWFTQLRQLLDKFNPNAKIVLGGTRSVNANFDRDTYKLVDYIVLGAADNFFGEFLESLKKSESPKSLATMTGTTVLDNRESLQKKNCPETEYLRKYSVQKKESLPIEISRGCVYNCRFCNFDRKESQIKSSDILRTEFIRNYERFGTTVYHFCDDCFNDSRKKVESVCETILQLPFKIEWISYARVDLAIRAPETLEMMIAAGAKGLFFGVESFNSEVAKNAGKGVPAEKVQEFLMDFRKKYSDKCLLQASFISGLPGETRESFQQTSNWLMENPSVDFIGIGPLVLSPYVEKFDKLIIDYSDYTRNPNAYGFQKVSFDPYFWEHKTMNSKTAEILAKELFLRWRKAHDTFLRSVWLYPLMRTLGYDWQSIAQMARDPSTTHRWQVEVPQRFKHFTDRYHEDLRIFWNPISSKIKEFVREI